jgi:hypothetical protein
MVDFSGMSDREILIAVAQRQDTLSRDFIKFTDTQIDCNVAIDDRVRCLEINGSKVARDLAVSVVVVGNRLDKVEGFVSNHAGQEKGLSKAQTFISLVIAGITVVASIVAAWWASGGHNA